MGIERSEFEHPLDGICGYCDERVSPATAVDHFADLHPGMEWSLLTWPDGTPALMDGDTP